MRFHHQVTTHGHSVIPKLEISNYPLEMLASYQLPSTSSELSHSSKQVRSQTTWPIHSTLSIIQMEMYRSQASLFKIDQTKDRCKEENMLITSSSLRIWNRKLLWLTSLQFPEILTLLLHTVTISHTHQKRTTRCHPWLEVMTPSASLRKCSSRTLLIAWRKEDRTSALSSLESSLNQSTLFSLFWDQLKTLTTNSSNNLQMDNLNMVRSKPIQMYMLTMDSEPLINLMFMFPSTSIWIH